MCQRKPSRKKMIVSWEGMLVAAVYPDGQYFAGAMFSEYYNMSSLLRQMPVISGRSIHDVADGIRIGTWRDRHLCRCDRFVCLQQ